MQRHRDAVRLAGVIAAATLAVTGMGVLAASPAGAVTVDVTTTVDGDPGSLRDAIDTINAAGDGPHTINLGVGQTYVLDECALGDNGGLTINVGPVTINGNGSTVRQTCSDARVFRYNDTDPITINDLTVTGGQRSGSSNGGGLKSFGEVRITNSTFVLNDAGGNGGAIWANNVNVTIDRSTFVDNNADEGGGAIYNINGSLTATNSTFVGNTANEGGVAFAVEQYYVFSTLADNGADVGGVAVAEEVAAFGTVISGTTTQSSVCDASLDSEGYNWTDAEDCDFGTATDVNDVGGDPLLGALADNGGPTETMLPAAGSPLLDAIPTSAEECGIIDIDQRGVARPQFDACDIGAVEVAPDVPTPTTSAPTVTTTTTAVAAAALVTPRFTG